MAQFPALPLWTDAYLADTGHLSGVESGAYLHLLIAAWRTPTCSLPDDDVRLARWARFNMRIWKRIKPTVMAFWHLDNGIWRQRRLSDERDHVRNIAALNRSAALHRWNGKPLKQLKTRHAIALHPQCERNAPTPTPTPTVNFTRFWKVYPKRKGQNPKHPAKLKFLAAIASGTPEEAIVDGAAAYAKEQRELGKEATEYIAQAVTWLNQRRWEDYQKPKAVVMTEHEINKHMEKIRNEQEGTQRTRDGRGPLLEGSQGIRQIAHDRR